MSSSHDVRVDISVTFRGARARAVAKFCAVSAVSAVPAVSAVSQPAAVERHVHLGTLGTRSDSARNTRHHRVPRDRRLPPQNGKEPENLTPMCKIFARLAAATRADSGASAVLYGFDSRVSGRILSGRILRGTLRSRSLLSTVLARFYALHPVGEPVSRPVRGVVRGEGKEGS